MWFFLEFRREQYFAGHTGRSPLAVWQVSSFLAFKTLPTLPIVAGGVPVITGVAIITFWGACVIACNFRHLRNDGASFGSEEP